MKFGKLIRHLEQHLGAIKQGWSSLPNLTDTGIQIVEHDTSTGCSELALATLGLSCYGLKSWASPLVVHQELLLFANKPDRPRCLPSILGQIAARAVHNRRAILKGEIIGPAGSILENASIEGFFATFPILLPEDAFEVEDEAGRRIVFVWLLPITRNEAEWARSHEIEAFETELDRQVPDVLDWYRDEMELP